MQSNTKSVYFTSTVVYTSNKMTTGETILVKWAEFKEAVADADADVLKLVNKEVTAAGARARKSIRTARKLGAELVKFTTIMCKDINQERKAKKTNK